MSLLVEASPWASCHLLALAARRAYPALVSTDPGPSMIEQDESLTGTTFGATSYAFSADEPCAPALTIVAHPNWNRVGERSRLNDPQGEGRIRLSRLLPLFGPPCESDVRPLADPHLSRNPVWLELRPDGGVSLYPEVDGTLCHVNGAKLDEVGHYSSDQLAEGLVLALAKRVVLLLHLVPPSEPRQDDLGMLGESYALRRLRTRIMRSAGHEVPVLLLGESGSGKERNR